MAQKESSHTPLSPSASISSTRDPNDAQLPTSNEGRLLGYGISDDELRGLRDRYNYVSLSIMDDESFADLVAKIAAQTDRASIERELQRRVENDVLESDTRYTDAKYDIWHDGSELFDTEKQKSQFIKGISARTLFGHECLVSNSIPYLVKKLQATMEQLAPYLDKSVQTTMEQPAPKRVTKPSTKKQRLVCRRRSKRIAKQEKETQRRQKVRKS